MVPGAKGVWGSGLPQPRPEKLTIFSRNVRESCDAEGWLLWFCAKFMVKKLSSSCMNLDHANRNSGYASTSYDNIQHQFYAWWGWCFFITYQTPSLLNRWAWSLQNCIFKNAALSNLDNTHLCCLVHHAVLARIFDHRFLKSHFRRSDLWTTRFHSPLMQCWYTWQSCQIWSQEVRQLHSIIY